MPIDPDFKKTGRLWLFGLYPLLAPQEARGQGLIRYRYAAPKQGDDTWSWNPGSRRVRRLNESLQQHGNRSAELRPRSLFGLQSED